MPHRVAPSPLRPTVASSRRARTVGAVAGWLAVLIGAVHIAFTACAYDRPSLDALWFAGSGIGVVLIGALTLLARGASVAGTAGGAAGVAPVAVAANGAGVALAVTFGVLTRWSEPQGPVLAATFLAGGAAAWSISRAARRPSVFPEGAGGT